MTAINLCTALVGMLGADFNGIIEHETNKAKYRAADRQASYRKKERQCRGIKPGGVKNRD